VRVLAGANVEALTIDLPGHGAQVDALDYANLAGYSDALVRLLDDANLHDAILVGHSLGGVAIPGAYTARPERVAHLVYLSAVVLADGESVIDELPKDRVAEFTAPPEVRVVAPPAPDVAWARWLADQTQDDPLADLTQDDPRVAWVVAHLTPQPLQPLRDRARLETFYAADPPRTYLWCTRDRAVPPTRRDRAVSTLGRGADYAEIEGNHAVMVSAPERLAAALLAIRDSVIAGSSTALRGGR
jgi:pimeloyl-ACP methyl ester carboxylesterase